MSQLIKLEKRFENALEKLELALSKNNLKEDTTISKKNEDVEIGSRHNIDELLVKIEYLEKAAKNDANEIDKLVRKLKEIFEFADD